MRFDFCDLPEFDAGITIVYDDCNDSSNLRSLPLFLRMGYSIFTYPLSWRSVNRQQREGFGYDFFKSTRATQEGLPDPLVIITTQKWESRYSYNSIKYMINKALTQKSNLVVVCDSPKFQLAGSHRPLIEESFVKTRLINYLDLYHRYSEIFKKSIQNESVSFPLVDSKNVFLQECATFQQLNRELNCKTISDLHHSILKTPENPLWKFWGNVLKPTYESPIPIEYKTSKLLNFILRRFEFQQDEVVYFLRELRSISERILHLDKSESVSYIKTQSALILFNKILKEYWKNNGNL